MKYLLFVLTALALTACAHEPLDNGNPQAELQATPGEIRIATFNVSMYRKTKGELITSLSNPSDPQIGAVTEIIKSVSPDILLINEFDYDADGKALALFQSNYLEEAFKYTYVAPSNTGVASGVDLDNDGKTVTEPGAFGYGNDAFGFGNFEGQYGFAIVSKYPINTDKIRSFQRFRWKDMPNNLLPTDWYSTEAQSVLRLSSKNHVDVPITVGAQTIHILAAHPTPPTFDGPEDRNGKRNFDEIRLIADYITPSKSSYLKDDNGMRGGLYADAKFVIMGDLNADPFDGDSHDNAIRQILNHDRVARVAPSSKGAVAAAEIAKGANDEHKSPHANDTADFRDINDDGTNAVGNLRLDYVLVSKNLNIVDSGVFWPAEGEPGYELVGPGFPPVSSDHRLVWVDVKLD